MIGGPERFTTFLWYVPCFFAIDSYRRRRIFHRYPISPPLSPLTILQQCPSQVTRRREPRSSRPSALNAIPSKRAEPTSRDPTSTGFSAVSLDWPTGIRIRAPIRKVVSCGERIPSLNIWRILRSTSRCVDFVRCDVS